MRYHKSWSAVLLCWSVGVEWVKTVLSDCFYMTAEESAKVWYDVSDNWCHRSILKKIIAGISVLVLEKSQNTTAWTGLTLVANPPDYPWPGSTLREVSNESIKAWVFRVLLGLLLKYKLGMLIGSKEAALCSVILKTMGWHDFWFLQSNYDKIFTKPLYFGDQP